LDVESYTLFTVRRIEVENLRKVYIAPISAVVRDASHDYY